MTTAVCTIATKRELAHARVLMSSVERLHPEWRRHLLLLDDVDKRFDPARERFAVLESRYLPLPDKQATLFFYGTEELRAAAKPWFFGWLFETKGFDEIVYLDPRTWVLSPLDRVEEALRARAPLVLTPHLLGESKDDKRPGELDVLRWGVHDGAMIGVSRHATAAVELLSWWQYRSYRHFIEDPTSGSFGDQRWLDLAAARWQSVTIRDPAYNVAYWNLAERRVERRGNEYRVDGEPLRFFQFAGFEPARPDRLSAEDERFGSEPPADVRELMRSYVDELLRAGHENCRSWDITFERFSDGTPIHPLLRVLYRTDSKLREACGQDPFRAGPSPFNEPLAAHRTVTRLMGHIWQQRLDLQRVFPNLDDPVHARAFATWFVASAEPEYGIGRAHVDPVRAELARAPEVVAATRELPDHVEKRPGLRAPSSRLRREIASTLRDRLLSRSLAENVGMVVGLGLSAARRVRPRIEVAEAIQPRTSGVSVGESELNSGTHNVPRLTEANSGLNIAGYVTADLGVGQSARSSAAAAEASGLDYCLVDFAAGTNSPKTDRSYLHKIAPSNEYPVNLVHVNADQVPAFRSAMGPAFFEGKYTIGYWHWELPKFPDVWLPSFRDVHEVWAPTQFVLAAISEKAPVPVVLVPHAIAFETKDPSRARFGLPERKFLFLMMYDLLSFQERKNPAATVRAFRLAFEGRSDVGLVIKVLNSDKCPEDMSVLRDSVRDLEGVVLLTGTLSRQDVYDLEAACDAFVSLHRSEGFGLGLAESMFLSKPVIGTNWSGNVDFMTHRNSCPVNYDLVPLERDFGPYEKGQIWADPDVEHAAWYMRRLVDDPAFAQALSARAGADMRSNYSPRAIGERYKARLKLLGLPSWR